MNLTFQENNNENTKFPVLGVHCQYVSIFWLEKNLFNA